MILSSTYKFVNFGLCEIIANPRSLRYLFSSSLVKYSDEIDKIDPLDNDYL